MNWRGTTDRILKTSRNIFGQVVTYQRGADAPFEVRGIFTEAYRMDDPKQSGLNIDSTYTIIDFRSDDLPYAPNEDDIVTVNGTAYTIWRSMPDGWARFRCFLEAVL